MESGESSFKNKRKQEQNTDDEAKKQKVTYLHPYLQNFTPKKPEQKLPVSENVNEKVIHMIQSIQFGILSSEDVLNHSVVEITETDFYENNNPHFGPKRGGVLDPRMGSIDRRHPCETCRLDFIHCPGHFGHIELPKPVLHYSYIKNFLLPTLDCICFHCGKLRLPKESLEYKKFVSKLKGKWKNKPPKDIVKKLKRKCSKYLVCQELVKMASGVVSDTGCGQIQPNYEFIPETHQIRAIFPNKQSALPPSQSGLSSFVTINSIISAQNIYEEKKRYSNKVEKKKTKTKNVELDSNKMNNNLSMLKPWKKYSTPESCFIPLNPEQILKILKSVDEEDYEILCFNKKYAKPSSMVLERLIVVPVCVRLPNKAASNTKTTEDWLTKQYQKIVQVCKDLKDAETEGNMESRDLNWQALITDISFLFDSKSFPERPRAASNNLKREGQGKGFVQRFGSKEGRFRGNIQGKRFNYSSRTVIFQDPYLDTNEFGIPLQIAMILEFPERLTDINRKLLEEKVRNGPHKYPGANFLTLPSGEKIDLKICKDVSKLLPLPIGTVVNRHLVDGDDLINNRPPTLHRLSIMGKRIRVYRNPKILGFGLKEIHCAPYNADFDGDETAASPAQDLLGVAETRELMSVTKNFMTPQSNRPSMGFVQDSLIGSKLLSKKDTFLTREQFFELFGMVWKYTNPKERKDLKIPPPAILKPKPLWTGKQVFSLVLPTSFCYFIESEHHQSVSPKKEPAGFILSTSQEGQLSFRIPKFNEIIQHYQENHQPKHSCRENVWNLCFNKNIIIWCDNQILEMKKNNKFNLLENEMFAFLSFTFHFDFDSGLKSPNLENLIVNSNNIHVKDYCFYLCNAFKKMIPHPDFFTEISKIASFEKQFSKFEKEFQTREKLMPLNDSLVQIKNGTFLTGILDKKSLGAAGGSMIGYIFLYYGEECNTKFINVWSRISLWYIGHIRGFTVGSKDFRPEPNQTEQVFKVLKEKDLIIKNFKNDKSLNYHQRERKINELMEKTRAQFTKDTIELLRKRNDNFWSMLGVKGTNLNPPQILNCFGPLQVGGGKRIENNYPGRTLPHFRRGDDGSIAKGFIPQHFMKGFGPTAFFHHAITARDSSAETNSKVTETGYLQRKLARQMEEYCVQYDMTVRDYQGNVVQFQYGDDGFDSMRLLKTGYLPFPEKSLQDYDSEFLWDLDHIQNEKNQLKLSFKSLRDSSNYIYDIKVDQISVLKKEKQIIISDRDTIASWKDFLSEFCSPWNFKFLLADLSSCYDIQEYLSEGITATEIANDVFELQKKLLKDHRWLNEGHKTTFLVQLRHEFYSKQILKEYNPRRGPWKKLLEKIWSLWVCAIVNPGEMVGIVAAGSMGAPATQMTLNTFTTQGNAEKNIQLGIPRLKEVIGASKNNHSPCFTVFLKPEYQENFPFAEKISKRMVETFFQKIVIKSEIISTNCLPLKMDQIWFDQFIQYPDSTFLKEINLTWIQNPKLYISYALRFELNSKFMISSFFTMSELVQGFRRRYQGLDFMYSDVYSSNCVLIIFIKKEPSYKKPTSQIENLDELVISDEEELKWAEEFKKLILGNHLVWGIEGINRSIVRKMTAANVKGFKEEKNAKPKYFIETEGETKKSFAKVLHLPYIDASKTTSTNMHDIYNIFGVEAARAIIIKEIQSIMNSYGLYINPRHIGLAADVMTWNGLEGFTRTGIGSSVRGKPTPVKNASFEKTWQNLQMACRYSQLDELQGVTESLLVGKEPRMGSSMIDVFSKSGSSISTFLPMLNYA